MKLATRAAVAAAALLSVASLTGCKAVEEGTKAISNTTIAGDNSPNANSVACGSERQEVELAVESFSLLKGHVPTEVELVPDYLRTESKLMDIAADGTVIPAPGAGCS